MINFYLSATKFIYACFVIIFFYPAIAVALKQSLYGGNLLIFGLHRTSQPFHALKPSMFITICAHCAAFVISSLMSSDGRDKMKLFSIFKSHQKWLQTFTFTSNFAFATDFTFATICLIIYLKKECNFDLNVSDNCPFDCSLQNCGIFQ